MKKNIEIIINNSELGAGTRGSSLGPDAILTVARKEKSTFFSENVPVRIKNENHLLDFKVDMDLKTLRAIFFQIIGKESIAFMGEPLNGLQMMGVLETRTLDFKNVIIMSVNEEKLPAGKSVNSFIPFVLKKHFKMPTHEERDAIFGYHF